MEEMLKKRAEMERYVGSFSAAGRLYLTYINQDNPII